MLTAFEIPPGHFRAGTEYQSRGRWYDGSLVRFFAGTKQPVGGWEKVNASSALTGRPCAMFGWRPNNAAVGRWLALGTIPILLASSIPAMGLSVFIAGLAISPGMIAANTVVEHLAPPKMLTEAFSWIGSALATGAAVGSIITGAVLDEISVRGGQSVGLFGGVLSGLVVIIWARHLKTPKATAPLHHVEPTTA